VAAALKGPVLVYSCLQIRANLPPGVDGWGLSLRGLMSMVVVGGLLITAVFWYLNRTVSMSMLPGWHLPYHACCFPHC
jgi:AAA family ATP:ADP antiporter